MVDNTKFIIYFLNFFGEGIPQMSQKLLQLLPRWHLPLHHNDINNLVTETGAIEQTSVM